MHRVELKDIHHPPEGGGAVVVPNAPCGVESLFSRNAMTLLYIVPNAPCGVESQLGLLLLGVLLRFLMHRVELKDCYH